MTPHRRIRPSSTRDTCPERKLDNDLAQAVVARGVPAAALGEECAAAGNLRAGGAAGGAAGPVHAAGLLVARDGPWPIADLLMDRTEADPIEELAALRDLWASQQEAYISHALNPDAAPACGVPGHR